MPARPLQNRVTPTGELIATLARGLMMGNRGGRFHDPATKTLGGRRWASRHWICCVLDFKQRHHDVWGRSYTALFFCDEVTALAAGHRPCFECRRDDARAFSEAVARGLGLVARPSAAELDLMLDAERREGRVKRLHRLPFETLPDGAMIEHEGAPHAVAGRRLLAWSAAGYFAKCRRPARGDAAALTPPTTLAALRAGFRPLWHPSAAKLR
jgi:hypothetical protein